MMRESFDDPSCEAYNDDRSRVLRVAASMPAQADIAAVASLLDAISHPVRLRVVFALAREPLCVCELAALLGMSMSAVAHHLALLRREGVLEVRKQGKFAYYHLVRRRVHGALTGLVEDLGEVRAA